MTTTITKRITLATVKAFIRKNRQSLLIQCKSSYDGMCDGVRDVESNGFSPALDADVATSNNLGIHGAWFVHGSRNSFSAYDDGSHVGFEVWNCCGEFVLAIAKGN